MRRTLAMTELIYVGEIRTRAVTTCVLRGGVDPTLLDEAFTAVLADHLSLRSRLERDGDSCFLSPLGPGELPRLEVRPGGQDALNAEYNTPMPLGGPLVRAVLLTGPDEDTFVLGVEHAICDGRSATALFQRIWRYYAEIQAGTYRAPDTAGHDWPAPIDDLFAPVSDAELDAYVDGRLEREIGPVAVLPFAAVGTEVPIPAAGPITTRRIWLDRKETDALVAFAKDSGVSVHGLVGAALLGAVRAGLSTDDAVLACTSTADLRDRVESAVSREVMIPAASWFRDTQRVAADTDPVGLARTLSANLRDGLARGAAELELRSLGRLVANPHLLASSVMMSNGGRVEAPPSPRGLEIIDMSRIAVSNKWVPQQGHGPLIASTMTVLGRFSIEMPYSVECFTTAQMDAIHDDVRASLVAFGASVPLGVGR